MPSAFDSVKELDNVIVGEMVARKILANAGAGADAVRQRITRVIYDGRSGGVKVNFRRGVNKGAATECQLPGFGTVDGERHARVSRLMAVAIHFQRMLQVGEVHNYADLARLGMVSRARLSQIMDLLHLAPEIQEELLFLPAVRKGRDPVTERDLRQITRFSRWTDQIKHWREQRRSIV